MRKDKTEAFYAIWGTNGVGVVTSWSKVLKNRNFLRHCNCEKFWNWREAEEKALNEYNAMNSQNPFYGPLRCNYILFSHQIRNSDF